MIPFLSIHNLSLSLQNRKTLDNISFSLNLGECVAIVGESGSGKSTLAKIVIGLHPSDSSSSGEILYKGFDLLKLSEQEKQKYRGKEIAMIFQDSLSSLNPTMQIGKQILESYQKHHPKASKAESKEKVLKLLEWIGIENPELRYKQYPHQFSGGMRQRIIIAIALAAEPKILIADEPTSALDAHIQVQILDLLKKIQAELNMSILFITHDLTIASQFTSRILVLHEGKLIEEASTKELFANPQHPYTKKLLSASLIPHTKKPISPKSLLEVSNLSFTYQFPIYILQNLSFSIHEGETLGLVGESGCGKTTLALLLMRLLKPTSGTINYKGSLQEMQIVFQDPYSSLNPRMTVLEIIREPLIIYRWGTKEMQKERVEELLYLVGLDPSFTKRYPHELSGGERQRVVIARALAPRPKFLICDEPITSLDAPVAAQIIQLLQKLQQELNLTYLFISHDLATVRHLSNHIAVLYKGKIVEFGATEEVYLHPKHPYTQSLLSMSFA